MSDNKSVNRWKFHDKYRIMPHVIKFLVWVAAIIAWWVIISLSIDMPLEYRLRHSTDDLRAEYDKMSVRYDSLNLVLENVIRRDENVFRKLFESNPYDKNYHRWYFNYLRFYNYISLQYEQQITC